MVGTMVYRMILPRSFYEQDTLSVARKMLGCFLVHREEEGTTIGRIVEDEAYVEHDQAAHSSIGITGRNRVLFGPPGHAYVFFIYGMHSCVNAVTGREGKGEAVLLRALEPLQGIGLMQARRKTEKVTSLCSGPGKLTQALHITLQHNGVSLTDSPLQIWSADSMPGYEPPNEDGIVETTRIGISKSKDLPFRFYIKGSRFVSRK
jgi:DNA-3-methyladenine glycosylase